MATLYANISGSPYVTTEPYTVTRTSGEIQDGWMITEKAHTCPIRNPAALASFLNGWRVHMHNGDYNAADPKAHACGWRPLGSFWPSRLTGDATAIEAWQKELEEFLEKQVAEERAAAEAERLAYEAARAAAAAKEAAEIAEAEKTTVVSNPLPDPLSARDLKILKQGWGSEPEKPTEHGCAYFDGAPWDTCFACEYEKDPAGYASRIRHSQLVQTICAQYHDTRVGERVKRWDIWILQQVVDEIQNPRPDRRFSDLQIHNKRFRLGYVEPGEELLRHLRALCGVY
jgi:hypothetical protein